MGVELRRGIAVYGTRGVMLELCSDELAASLGGIVAADPCLRVPLQLVQSSCYGGSMGFPHAIVSAYQSGERHRLRS